MGRYKQLTYEQRCQIEVLKKWGMSQSDIAERMVVLGHVTWSKALVSQFENHRRGLALTEFLAAQEDRVSFNRRFHLKDGTVRFNPGVRNPAIVRAAGPINPCSSSPMSASRERCGSHSGRGDTSGSDCEALSGIAECNGWSWSSHDRRAGRRSARAPVRRRAQPGGRERGPA